MLCTCIICYQLVELLHFVIEQLIILVACQFSQCLFSTDILHKFHMGFNFPCMVISLLVKCLMTLLLYNVYNYVMILIVKYVMIMLVKISYDFVGLISCD